MQESTIMMERLTIEETDLVSFSIKSTKEGIFLILEITTVSEYGLDKIKKIKMDLNQFSEAIASFRANSKNFLDNPKDYGIETGIALQTAQKFFAATAEQSNALTE